MSTTSKPTVYISSTIYDFRDLRSALKYWLEELGYEVMLSEFNDFTKPLDENSYIACLRAVESANYFILLIGGRVGGLFDTKQGVSITRMEYRTAYELMQAARMKLVTFVREDLWNVREDRRALRELLIEDYKAQKELSDDDVNAIVKHSSTFVNDADAVFDFMREVGRVDEMKKAMAGESSFPIGNWIHQFSTFEEIIKALNTLFVVNRRLSTVALITNLRRELLYNLTLLTGKGKKDGVIRFNTFWGDVAREQLKGDYHDSSSIPAKHLQWLGMYLIVKCSGSKLLTQFLEQALASGEFLEYSVDTNRFNIGLIHDALLKLQENIRRLRSLETEHFEKRIDALIAKFSPRDNPIMKTDSIISFSNEELATPFAFYDCEKNISDLCVALIKGLDGEYGYLQGLKLRPTSPVESMAENIKAETSTIEDIENWLRSQ
jgi:hypothetical protein